MALSSYLLLLLVSLSVSAVHKGLKEPDEVLSPDAEDETLGGCLPQGKNRSMEFPLTSGRSGKERHSLYHTYNSHSNNWIIKTTVQFDGVEIYCFILKRTGHWTYSRWNITMKDVDYIFRNYSKDVYHHLKDTDSDLTQRYGCEVERSSSGDVTLLNTTAEFRLNGKIILRFNVDRDEWEVLDKRFLAVKTEWNSLTHFNQIIKDYLQQGCTDRLRSYLKFYDEDIRKRTSSVAPSEKPLPYTEHPDEDIRNRTSSVVPNDKPQSYTEHPDEDIRNRTSSVAPSDKPRSYTEHPDEDIRNSTSSVVPSDKPLPYPEDCDEGSPNSPHKENNENEGKEGTGIFLVVSCIVITCFAVAMAFALLMKKIAKGKVVKPLVKDAYRGYSNVMMNDDQDGGDAVQTQKSFSSSMEFLPPLMKRFSSMEFLPPYMERFTASMKFPPDLAEDDDDDDQTCSKVRLAQTAGLTTAGGRLRSTTISLPEFGSWNSRDIWV